jgi:hypothetical protein
MGAFTYSLKNSILDFVFGATALSTEASHQIALTTTEPTISAAGTEVSGGSYARVTVTNNKTNWSAASNGLLSNATAISFPTPTASWGTVVGVDIYNAAGTTRVAFATLTASKTIGSGDPVSFPIGDLDINLIGT